MSLKKGDRVKFLNDTGGGVLTSFLDKSKVMVRTEDGFEIPVMLNQIIPDKGNFMSNEKPEEPVKPVTFQETKPPPKKLIEQDVSKVVNTEEEICFAILPKPTSSDLFAYLVNNSSYSIHYVITIQCEEETLLFDQGMMDARTQMKIKKFLPGSLNEIIHFDIQVLFYKEDLFIPRDPVSRAVFMSPSEVYSGKALTENDYFDRKALVFNIVDFKRKTGYSTQGGTDLTGILKEKLSNEKPENASLEEKKPKNGLEEVDLHIEAITDSYIGLSNSEIIEMQMARFKIALDTAIIHKTRRIVFIHGVGNGKLKYSLRKELDDRYPDLKFQDASFKEYGYGATMVIIP